MLSSFSPAPLGFKVNPQSFVKARKNVRFGTGESSSTRRVLAEKRDQLIQFALEGFDQPRARATLKHQANNLTASLMADPNLRNQLQTLLDEEGKEAAQRYLQSDTFQSQASEFARNTLHKTVSQPLVRRKEFLDGLRNGVVTTMVGYYGVPLVTDNQAISTAVTTTGLGMTGWSGFQLAKTLANPPDGSEERVAQLVQHVKEGNLPEVKKMVGSYVDINKPNRNDWTPLQMAASYGHTPVIYHLLSAGADINKDDQDGRTPLWIATVNQQLDSVLALVAKGANVNKADDKGDGWGGTPLWVVANDPDKKNVAEELAKILINAGANLNRPSTKWGTTPMQTAARTGKPHIVKLLRKHGAIDVDAQQRAEEQARKDELARQEMLRRQEAERQREDRIERGFGSAFIGIAAGVVGGIIGVDLSGLIN